jgi:peptide/nickel transport system substrate-binding protein
VTESARGRRLGRRDFVAWALATSGAFAAHDASALGRTPYGGRLRLSVPWALASVDPHDPGDAAGALFGTALFDSLYAVDSKGVVTPALADAAPTSDGGGLLVKMRPGLRTAKGASLDARDAVASLARAKKLGATPLLARFGTPTVSPHDASTLAFPAGGKNGAADRYALSRALASPLAAVVPRSFDPRAPDGTGPFSALVSGGLALGRNVAAARGAAFLEHVDVAPAKDLAESLRAFEAEQDDIGWLGTGLFGSRKNAAKFDLGRAAWIMLGASAGLSEVSTPGALQRLVDELPRDALAHLGMGPLPTGKAGTAWRGPPVDVFVDRDAPHLVEIAEALSTVLSAPDHELTVRRVSRAEARDRRKPGLFLGVARPMGPSTLETLAALATFDDPARAADLVKAPPKLGSEGPRALTSQLKVAVVGELRVSGAAIADLALEPDGAGGWDLGASFIRPKKAGP